MPHCPSCSAGVQPSARFCDRCGTDLSDLTAAVSHAASDASMPHSSLLDQGRFAPGALLDERYRVIGLLGRGGMGEVYRADDLKLGQSVALKFLPTEMEQDQARLNLLLNEVRLARQVSHPNVCRVYDIGQIQGAHFMAMEYVDGEDLSSLLRRIGRLPQEKALEISRQICAGLAAAHEQGILHRDLKPANVMIDGRGRVKLTDFGLSGLATRIEGEAARVGTPAYMSPEQLSGREATQSSDIYALGLVLYEIFTGKRAFGGKSIAEISRMQQQSSLTSLSSIVTDIDETVERVILRCLEMEPTARPGSALAVAAALPGGDPLAAALAAGETPSPEMVADAVAPGSLHPAVGIGALAVIVLSILLSFAGSERDDLYSHLDLEHSPEEMAGRSEELLARLGVDDPGPHVRRGLDANGEYLDWIGESGGATDQWNALANPPRVGALYWMRYSADEMIPDDVHEFLVVVDDPHQRTPGQGTVWLDLSGHLNHLEIVPTVGGDSTATRIDPATLFGMAGLAMEDFTSASPAVPPGSATDRLLAWRGPISADIDGLVQAGWFDNELTHFRVVGPWNLEAPAAPANDPAGLIMGTLMILIITTCLVLTRRNLKARRTDLNGTFRVALFFLLMIYGAWIFAEVRLETLAVGSLFQEAVFGRLVAHGLAHAFLVGLIYIAIEPYVRRLWPETMVGWSRLLIGRVRDPLVGRDLLLGMAVFGGTISIGAFLFGLAATAADIPTFLSFQGLMIPFDGIRQTLSWTFVQAESAVSLAMLVLVFLLVFRLVFRKTWITVSAFLLLFLIMGAFVVEPPDGAPGWFRIMGVAGIVGTGGAMVLVVLRFGLLGAISGVFLTHMLSPAPLTWDFSRWYAGSGLLMAMIVLGVAAWAFYISLGGRQLLKDSVLGD